MDSLSAARWLMTLALVFHIVFAAIGIGLPLLLVIAQRRWLKTGQDHLLRLARKWSKAVALLFAVGAISGTALSFELALLWPGFLEKCGGVVGHIFGLEGFAFFLEAVFIGLYLYGWDKLSPRAHWWCGVVIAVAGAASGVLILGVNAWMQLPVGFQTDAAGNVTVTDPIAIFKQYGWLTMAMHSTLACYMAVGFVVAGVYAWGWLKGRRDDYHRAAIRIAMSVGVVAAVLQPVSGDLLAKFVFKRDPVKFAAMEGQFHTERNAPLRIGGIPDEQTQTTPWSIEIPGLLGILANWDPKTEVPGLDIAAPRADQRPPVALTHLSFQVMVGLGFAMALVGLWYWLRVWRKKDAALDSRPMLWSIVALAGAGLVALEAGWIVTEVGRQPYVIVGTQRLQPLVDAGKAPWMSADMSGYPGLLTRDAATTAPGVQAMFYGFVVLYLLLGVTVVVLLRYLARSDISPVCEPRT
jgi:cytochrome d ubiquinol oxidase subunit I